MLIFTPEKGMSVPTIKLNIEYENEDIGHILLVPHSTEMYEIHLSNLTFNKDFSSIKNITKAIEIYREAISFGFTYMDKLQTVFAMIPINNRFALFASKHCGMSLNGTIKKGHLFKNNMIDIEIYSLSRGEVTCL